MQMALKIFYTKIAQSGYSTPRQHSLYSTISMTQGITLCPVHYALLLTPICWKSSKTNARLMAFALSFAVDPTFGIHSHKTLDAAQPCHLLMPNWKPSSSHSISAPTNINIQFLLVCVCVCACVHVCACVYRSIGAIHVWIYCCVYVCMCTFP